MEKSSHEIEPWNNKDIVLSVFKGVESPFSRASQNSIYYNVKYRSMGRHSSFITWTYSQKCKDK